MYTTVYEPLQIYTLCAAQKTYPICPEGSQTLKFLEQCKPGSAPVPEEHRGFISHTISRSHTITRVQITIKKQQQTNLI